MPNTKISALPPASTVGASDVLPIVQGGVTRGATAGQIANVGVIVYNAATPLAQWTIPHQLGRLPGVALYDANGNGMLADLNVTASVVTVTFANPTAGSAVLS